MPTGAQHFVPYVSKAGIYKNNILFIYTVESQSMKHNRCITWQWKYKF